MKLKVITPQLQLFEGEVDSVTLPGLVGELQVLPGHTHLLTLLRAGELTYGTAAEVIRFSVGEGHVEVHDDVVTVAVDRAEPLAGGAERT